MSASLTSAIEGKTNCGRLTNNKAKINTAKERKKEEK